MRSQGGGIQLPLSEPSVCVCVGTRPLSLVPLAFPPVSWGPGGGIRGGVLGYWPLLINSPRAATPGNHS